MSKSKRSPGKKNGGEGRLSKKAIQERIRTHSVALIDQAVYIAMNAKNNSNKLGAIKLLLSKIAPDLKAQEISGELDLILQNVIRTTNKRTLDAPPQANRSIGEKRV